MSEVRASGSHIDHSYDIAGDSLKAFDWLGDLIPPEAIFTKTYAEGGAFYGYVLGGLPNDDSWFMFPAAFLGNAQFDLSPFNSTTSRERIWGERQIHAWLGNSRGVAEDHYLMLTENDFETATIYPAHYPAHSSAVRGHLKPSGKKKTAVSPANARDTAVEVPPREVNRLKTVSFSLWATVGNGRHILVSSPYKASLQILAEPCLLLPHTSPTRTHPQRQAGWWFYLQNLLIGPPLKTRGWLWLDQRRLLPRLG